MPCLINTSHTNKSLQQRLCAVLAADEAAEWIATEVKPIKQDPGSMVGVFQHESKSYYLKAYYSKGLAGRIANRLGLSRAYRTWNKACQFKQAFPTAEPVLLMTAPDGSAVYYVTDFIEGANSIMDCLVGPGRVSADCADDILYRYGQLLGDIHRRGWVHGDLKWTNLLLDQDHSPQIVDLDGLKCPGRTGAATSGKDLARFILNAEEFLQDTEPLERFLQGYCESRAIDRSSCIKEFYPALLTLRARHLKKYGARGQQLF